MQTDRSNFHTIRNTIISHVERGNKNCYSIRTNNSNEGKLCFQRVSVRRRF